MTSLKTLIAGVAASLPLLASAQQAAAPAPSATPLASLYGTLNVNLQYTEASGANRTNPGVQNVKPRAAISIDSSNIGVRGGVEVVNGMKVVFQCETQASIDGEDSRTICNRNSRIGLSGNWGTLFYGNWDTPYKALAYGTKADDPFLNTDVFGFQGIFGSPGYAVKSTAFNGGPNGGTVAVTGAGFDQRAANSVAYWTPKFMGLSARFQYSVDENRTPSGSVDPQLLSAAVNYDKGGLSVAAAAEYHQDLYGIRTLSGANTGTRASKDLGLKAAAGYELPLAPGTLRVVAMVEQLSYAQDKTTAADRFKDYSRLAWLAGATFRTGNHEVRGRYGQAFNPDITAANGAPLPPNAENALGAQHYSVGYAYHLAPNAQLYAFYTQILNQNRARYTFGISGAAAVTAMTAAQAGADPTAGGVGIRFAF